jgi:hypothetical protein
MCRPNGLAKSSADRQMQLGYVNIDHSQLSGICRVSSTGQHKTPC